MLRVAKHRGMDNSFYFSAVAVRMLLECGRGISVETFIKESVAGRSTSDTILVCLADLLAGWLG